MEHIGSPVKYPCDQCNYKATYKSNLNTHLKSKHKGIKYPCEQCDYKASFKVALLTHLKSKHEGIKYPCDQCDYTATRDNLGGVKGLLLASSVIGYCTFAQRPWGC